MISRDASSTPSTSCRTPPSRARRCFGPRMEAAPAALCSWMCAAERMTRRTTRWSACLTRVAALCPRSRNVGCARSRSATTARSWTRTEDSRSVWRDTFEARSAFGARCSYQPPSVHGGGSLAGNESINASSIRPSTRSSSLARGTEIEGSSKDHADRRWTGVPRSCPAEHAPACKARAFVTGRSSSKTSRWQAPQLRSSS